MKKLNFAIILIFLVLFSGCGYKPTSSLSKNIMGDKVYVHVSMSLRDPKNSAALKDAVNEAIVSRLKGSLVLKEEAHTLLHVRIKSFKFRPIIYNEFGYITSYKTLVTLSFDTVFKDKSQEIFTATGEYDFPIEANSVISDTKRFIAIKNASLKALDEYMAFLSIKGLSYEYNK